MSYEMPELDFSNRALPFIEKELGYFWANNPDRDDLGDEQVEVIYSLAYNFWRSGAYEKAKGSFLIALKFRPKNIQYIEALARCYGDLGLFYYAASCYAYSIICGGGPIKNLLNMSKCYTRLGLADQAYATLLLLVNVFESEAHSEEDLARIKMAKNIISLLKKRVISSSEIHAPSAVLQ